MKFRGFTLAEVLIVLGIIGVISALTMPTFTANTANAQIGPKLGKAVASFEEATRLYMTSHNMQNLSDISETPGESRSYAIMNALRENMNWECTDNSKTEQSVSFQSKDGITYEYSFNEQSPVGDFANSTLPKDYYIGRVMIRFDHSRKVGANLFFFALYDDGSLVPYGAKNWAKFKQDGGIYWNGANGCPNKNSTFYTLTKGSDTDGTGTYACAGSIFEQNMKVNYKLPKS